MIAQQTGNNCVNRALSIMRLALGYENGMPDFAMGDVGPKSPSDIFSMVGYWFPYHQVDVMCGYDHMMSAGSVPENCNYIGVLIPDSNEYWDTHLCAFSYFVGEQEDSHFVIGVPCIYEGMKTSIVVAVKYD